MQNIKNQIIKPLLDFIFPPYCVICKEPLNGARVVCDECFDDIIPIPIPFCNRCGTPLKPNEDITCRRCNENPLALRYIRGVGIFAEPLRTIIHLFKYDRKLSLGKRLSNLLVGVFNSSTVLQNADIITPVPLHSVRYRERGYNQSEIIARGLSDGVGIRYENLVKRIRYTRSQTLMNEQNDRIKNVEGAFKVIGDVKGKNVLIVDDVTTTGATLNAVAKEMLEAEAQSVSAIVLAIAIRKVNIEKDG